MTYKKIWPCTFIENLLKYNMLNIDDHKWKNKLSVQVLINTI